MSDKKPREFNCMYDPETEELTYGHRHGCTDGFESIKVREVMPDSPYSSFIVTQGEWVDVCHQRDKYRVLCEQLMGALDLWNTDGYQIQDKTSIGEFLNYINSFLKRQQEALEQAKKVLGEK